MKREVLLIGFLMLVHFLMSAYFSAQVLAGIPHIPDAAIYYRQGILLSQGQLYVSNFTYEPKDAFKVMGSFFRNDTLHFHYNHFWPLLLALPIKFGIAELANPLLSALSLLLIYIIAKRLYNSAVGWIAAIIYCFSPFTIIIAGDFMPHTSTQLFLLAGLYCVLNYISDKKFYVALLAGMLWAYAADMRPVTAAGVVAPIAVYFMIFHRRDFLRWKSVWFLIGAVSVASLFLIDNTIIAGGPFSTVHPVLKGGPVLGIGNLISGMNYADSLLGYLPPIVFYGFIPLFFFSIAMIPLIMFRKKEDYLLFSVFVSLLVIYMFTVAMGIHGYGPRYAFEGLFAIFILAARGVLWMIETAKGRARKIIVMFLCVLLLYNLYGLYAILPQYKHYNGINSDLFEELKQIDLENSIVLIPQSWSWYSDGIAATLYDPAYKKSFFLNELSDNAHLSVLEKYPERKVYRIEATQVVPVVVNLSAQNSSVV